MTSEVYMSLDDFIMKGKVSKMSLLCDLYKKHTQ